MASDWPRLPTSTEIQADFGCEIIEGDDLHDICRFTFEDSQLELAIFPYSLDISIHLKTQGRFVAKVFIDQLIHIALEPRNDEIYISAYQMKCTVRVSPPFSIDLMRLSGVL